jgi:hypothetical protein
MSHVLYTETSRSCRLSPRPTCPVDSRHMPAHTSRAPTRGTECRHKRLRKRLTPGGPGGTGRSSAQGAKQAPGTGPGGPAIARKATLLVRRFFLRPAFSTCCARANHRIVHRGGVENRFTSLVTTTFRKNLPGAILPVSFIRPANTPAQASALGEVESMALNPSWASSFSPSALISPNWSAAAKMSHREVPTTLDYNGATHTTLSSQYPASLTFFTPTGCMCRTIT